MIIAWKEVNRLNKKWGRFEGTNEEIIRQVKASIACEYRAGKAGTIKVSAGLLREMRGEMILCGKLLKAIK